MKLFFKPILFTLALGGFAQTSVADISQATGALPGVKLETPRLGAPRQRERHENEFKNDVKAKKQKMSLTPKILMSTSMGDMIIELDRKKAPISVKNFVKYINKGAYDGKIFHRVIPGFMVQGGGFDVNFERGFTSAPIVNESNNGLKNLRGTISMARTMDPDSATNQFFINLNDNPNLDPAHGRPGYAVFGKVVTGIEVIDKIAAAPQGKHGGRFVNAPNAPVVINSVTVLESKKSKKNPKPKKPGK